MRSGGRRGFGPQALALLALLAALATAARADDRLSQLDLEQLLKIRIVTASKIEESVKEAPGVVTVVTREEIAAFGATNLAEVLNRVASVHMMSSHLWVQAKAVVRGNLLTHSDHHMLVLVNGRPFRDAFESNTNFVAYTAFPLDVIDHIEVVRGPGSVLYGSNAVSGVINIITRKAGDHRLSVSAGGGSFGAERAGLGLGLKGDSWDLMLRADYFDEDGWPFQAAAITPTIAARASHLDYGETNKTVAAFFKSQRLTAQVWYADVRYDNLGRLPHGLFAGHVAGKRSFTSVGYEHPLSNTWKLTLNADVNHWEKHIVDSTAPGTDDSQDRVLSTVFEASAAGRLGEKTNAIVGALTELRKNYGIIQPVPNVRSPGVTREFSENLHSAYAQVDHRPVERLKLIGGMQYNRTEAGHSSAVPRLGAIYDVNGSVTFKTLWGRAFRTATPLEQFLNIPGTLVGNPDLSPERATTFDASVHVHTSSTQTSLTFFDNRYEDLVGRVPLAGAPPGTLTFRNLDQHNVRGVEAEHKARLGSTMLLTGSFTYQDERDGKLYVPSHMAKVGLAHTGERLTAGVFYSHFGQPRGNAPFRGLELNPRATSIDLVSLNLSYRFPGRVPVTISAYGSNLLDDGMHYTEFARGWTNTLPIGPGRAVYLRLKLDL